MALQANTVAYSSIKDQLQTGDVILFHGPSAESVLIEKLDKSPFSHVGIVVYLAQNIRLITIHQVRFQNSTTS